MTNGNLMFFFAVAGALALLAIVQFFLAARHDQVISTSGPRATLEELAARISERRATLSDIDEELRKRREALQDLAQIGADVDEMQRRRDELLAEWQQLEERRNEVRALRAELEDVRNDKLAADADLAEARGELEEVRERLEKAERLVSQISGLTDERDDLARKIEELRDEVRKLKEAEDRVAALDERANDLERQAAALEGRVAALDEQSGELKARIAADRDTLAQAEVERSRVNAEVASSEVEKRSLRSEIESLEEGRAALEARKSVLEQEVEKLTGAASGRPGTSDDPLRELKTPPPVLRVMEEWKASGLVAEVDALRRVTERFKTLGLDYAPRTLRAFHTAMKVNETTQMAVLAGISGTGKSQLPRQYAAGMGIGFLQVPVQPRWDSPQDLMGFYNYIEQRFRPTDMARALYALDELNNGIQGSGDRMLMILLDEMNLARVEYYFSDFLSRLESRPPAGSVGDKDARKDAEIELEIPKMANPPRIFPGYNLLFAGTMNEDESTQSLSEKVVDRANLLRFAAPKQTRNQGIEGATPPIEALSRTRWKGWTNRPLARDDASRTDDEIGKMVELMKRFGRPFGHRLGRAIMAYVRNYPEAEGIGDRVSMALADQIEMRLLPKLRGVDVEQASREFTDMRAAAERFGDEKLAEAITESERAAESTGQFVWLGVTR